MNGTMAPETTCLVIHDSESLMKAVTFFLDHDGTDSAAGPKRVRVQLKNQKSHSFDAHSSFSNQNFDDLLDAIEAAKGVSVESLSLDMKVFQAPVDAATVDRFVGVFGEIQSLKELVCDGRFYCGGALDFQNLTILLERTKSISSLVINDIHFDGTTQWYTDFAEAIAGLSTLTQIKFRECNLLAAQRIAANMVPVLSAIAKLPLLTDIDVSCWVAGPEETDSEELASILSTICSRPNLTCLEFNSLLNREHCLPAIMSAIMTSKSIKVLTLTVTVQKLDCSYLCAILLSNAILEELFIRVCDFEDGAIARDSADGAMALVIDALRTNEKLRGLTLKYRPIRHFAGLLRGLQQHGLLLRNGQNLQLPGQQPQIQNLVAAPPIQNPPQGSDHRFFSKQIQESMVSMLADNMTLQSLCFKGWEDTIDELETVQRMQLFVSLNKWGRKRLVTESGKVSPLEWVNALAAASDNVDGLFHFLSLNPSLCSE